MKENIMVCVANLANAKLLIKRGHELSEAFGGKCLVLCVRNEQDDDYDYDWLDKKDTLESYAKKYNAQLIIEWEKDRKTSTVIADVANKEKVKQIILGQPARSRWDIVVHGSIINGLFAKLNGVDLHIVEVTKTVLSGEKQYEKGTPAFIIEGATGHTVVFPDNRPDCYLYEGLFFQGQTTEFCHGLFKVISEDEIHIYKVSDGSVDVSSPSIIKK